MFELMITSFPAVIQYFLLKRRGESMTVWNMKTAVFLWALLAFGLFLAIFYFHPKTYAGIVPFRTVSVVAQTSGPVTEIMVENGQRVEAGDLLFRIENSAQTAALAEAKAQLELLSSEEAKAKDNEIVARSSVEEATTALARLREDLQDAETLLQRGAGTADAVLDLRAEVSATEATLRAAEAQLDLARVELEQSLPAQITVAETAVKQAEVALSFTEVHSLTGGEVTQLALNVGSPATTLVLRPAMIIIPDRDPDVPMRLAAGFSQIAGDTIYPGMPAEIACETTANLGFKNSVMPAHVHSIQPAVATGQIQPSANLLDMGAAAQNRGTVLVLFELKYKEHEELLLDGSGCIVQTYTTNLHGFWGHVIATTAIIKAVGLRAKVLGAILTGVGLTGGGH